MENFIPQGQVWTFQPSAFLEQSIETKYIEPEYEVHDEYLIKSSPYLVVSAPGAVGKSAFAQHLKKKKNAMLWNLAKLRLGSNTFIGSVLEAVGTDQLSSFLASIDTGNTTIVFDAIDEAEMHSGWTGVQDFLQEVIKYTQNARPASVIFLARRDTAEMLSLALEELIPAGRTHATAGIGFFTRERAIEFVLSYIENTKGRAFYERNLHVLESKISEALSLSASSGGTEHSKKGWNSEEQERFFGYAPVLQTIGKLLAETDNPYNLDFNGSRSGYVAIVAEILERILDREKEKMDGALAQRFPGEEDQFTELYSREDQQARILNLLTSDDAAYSVPPTVKPQIAGELVEMLHSFLPQHPFLDGSRFTGPAFRDYVLAHGLVSRERRFSSELWIDISQPLYTPILASLYHVAGSGQANADDAELLYESANAGALNGQSALLLFFSEQAPDKLTLEISSDDADPLGENLVFNTAIPNEVQFVRRLNNAQVIMNLPLVFGRREHDFIISDSEVQVKSIRIDADRILVRSETGRSTHIESVEPVIAPPTLRLDVRDQQLLTVSWPGSKKYPWTSFSTESQVRDSKVDVRTTLHVVARILSWFRKDRRKEYGRYRDLIVKHIVGQSPSARYALGFIDHIGALSESGTLLFIDTDILDSYEVSWQKIRSDTVSQKAIDAVEAYLRATPQPPQFQ